MMNMKKMLALLLAVVMVLGMIPFGAMAEEAETVTHIETCLENCALEDCACECHAEPETPAEEPKQEENPVTPLTLDDTTEETPVVDATKTEETPVVEDQKTEETPVIEDEKTEQTPVCTCTPVEGVHAAECALNAKTEEPPVVEEPKVEETPVCTCTPVEGVHVEGCALYQEHEKTLYEQLMDAETLEEFEAIVEAASEEELSSFTCEEFDEVDAHYIYLKTGEIVDRSPIVYEEYIPAVNYDNVAPLVGASK